MKVYKKLYVGNEVEHIHQMKKTLKLKFYNQNYYCIVLYKNRHNIELYSMVEMQKPYQQKHDFLLIGIAKNYDDGLNIILKITEDSLQDVGHCNLVDYILLQDK